MQYILSVKDNPHEIAVQGTNGNYPEISYTFVSHTITGMMGVEPNAPENAVSTVARLPQDVGYVKTSGIQMGTHELDVRHDGLTNSTITNHSSDALTWTAQFYGDYDYILANGRVYEAEKSDINGEVISYAVVTVAAGETVNAKVVSEEAETDAAAALEVSAKIDAIGDVTLESEEVIAEAREAYEALSDTAKAMVGNVNVLEAAEAKLEALKNGHEEAVAAAKAVEEKIAAIGTVTLDSKTAIEAARTAYDALSDEAKAMVANVEVLKAAEAELAKLEEAAAIEAAAKAVDEKITAIGTVTLDSKTAIEEARAAYDALSDAAKAKVEKLSVLETAEAELKKLEDAEKDDDKTDDDKKDEDKKDESTDDKKNDSTGTKNDSTSSTTGSTSSSNNSNVNTGDPAMIAELCLAMAASVGGITFVGIKRRKNRKEEE